MTREVWIVRLSAAAAADFQDIIDWTEEHFGPTQSNIYEQSLKDVLTTLEAGAESAGAKLRGDIGRSIYTLHMARRWRRGRHVIVLRATKIDDRPIVDVLRILHDAMDLRRHVLKVDDPE